MKINRIAVAALLVASAWLCSGALADSSGSALTGDDTGKPDLDEVRAIAEEGFIYGLPIVMNYDLLPSCSLNGDFDTGCPGI